MSKDEQRPSPQNLVVNILNHKVYLQNISADVMDAIKEIGAIEYEIAGRPVCSVEYSDDHELAKKLHHLNRLGFLFVGEPAGWPPAEIFDHIREKGLLREKFREISWRSPGDWFVVQR